MLNYQLDLCYRTCLSDKHISYALEDNDLKA